MDIGDFFRSIPWWVYGIIIVAVAVWIWYKLPMELKGAAKRFIYSGIALPVFFAAFWWWWYSRGNIIPTNQANFWMPLIGFAILLVIGFYGSLRYHTKQMITPNFHGSFTKAWEINDFVVINIGAFNFGISMDYATKVLIVRKETFHLFENSGISLARVGFLDLDKFELDPDVEVFVKNNSFLKFAKNKIYYGWFDDINEKDWDEEQLKRFEENKESNEIYNFLKKELKINNPSITDLYRRYRNLCADYNKLYDNYNRVIKMEDKMADFAKRQKDIYGDRRKMAKEIPEGYEEM